ncbi:MAG: molybdopterin dinucleotide binding domain-containing protein [Actinomycetota bacterium]
MATTRSYCRFCGALCGVLVETDGDRVLSVRGDHDHPLSRGYTCPKGRALPAFHHHPDRLDQPLLHGRAVSWDEMLGDLAGRLQEILATSGPDAVGVFSGTGSAFDVSGRRLGERFVQALGSRSRYSTATVDNACKPLVAELMAGHPGLIPALDHHHATLVLLFGTNPVVSHGHLNAFPDPVVRLRDLADRGEVWVIDPRRHETAQLATRHLAIRPGSDYALLAYLIRSLLSEEAGGADWAYLEQHARHEDVERLTTAVAPFDRETAARRCGLPEADLDDLLAAVRRHRRVAGQSGTGVTMSRAANASEWLLWALHVVTGSYEQPGGMWFNPGFMKCFDRRRLRPSDGAPAPGPRSRPELPGRWAELPCAAMADEIEAGNLRALFVLGGNPLTAFPQPERLAAAFRRLDVLAVADVVRTEVTALASHTFACAGQLERADLPGLADTFQMAVAAQYTPAVVAPAAGRKPMWWPFAELGRRLDLDLLPAGLTPESCTDDDLLAVLADRSAASFAELKASPTVLVASEGAFGWVARNLLPEGRWRLAPPPLVEALAALATDDRSPALALIPRRQLRHMNAQLRDGAAGAVRADAPEVLLHPDDATAAGVGDGEKVRVASDHGALVGCARLAGEVRRGTVSVPHGFDEPNVAHLTDTVAVDPLTGMVRQSGVPVTVEPVTA